MSTSSDLSSTSRLPTPTARENRASGQQSPPSLTIEDRKPLGTLTVLVFGNVADFRKAVSLRAFRPASK